MFRIDDPSAAAALPTPEAAGTEGYFTEGNPGSGVPATLVRASWLNAIQEELRAIVTAAGLAPSKSNTSQVLAAIEALMQRASPQVSAAGGTADALTGTFTPAITALTNGMSVFLRAGSANATTTPTFTPNSGTVAAKTIVKGNGLALAAGDIAGAGHWLELQYDATLDKWVLQNPATFTKFGASLSTNGYQKLPSGLIIQWGVGTAGASGASWSNAWPLAWPNGPIAVIANHIGTDASVNIVIDSGNFGTTTFGMRSSFASGSVTAHWVAIGY